MRIANLTTTVAIAFFIAGFASAAQESEALKTWEYKRRIK